VLNKHKKALLTIILVGIAIPVAYMALSPLMAPKPVAPELKVMVGEAAAYLERPLESLSIDEDVVAQGEWEGILVSLSMHISDYDENEEAFELVVACELKAPEKGRIRELTLSFLTPWIWDPDQAEGLRAFIDLWDEPEWLSPEGGMISGFSERSLDMEHGLSTACIKVSVYEDAARCRLRARAFWCLLDRKPGYVLDVMLEALARGEEKWALLTCRLRLSLVRDPGPTSAKALSLAELEDLGDQIGFILSPRDEVDVFDLGFLAAGTALDIAIVPPRSAIYWLYVLDASGRVVASSEPSKAGEEARIMICSSKAGRYYVKAIWVAGSGLYRLGVQAGS